MMKYTKEDIKRICKEENIRYIRLQFTDMLGTLKNVEIPVTGLDEALNNEVMFDGSSIEGFVRTMEADMFLVPDLNTFLISSWEDTTTVAVSRQVYGLIIFRIRYPTGILHRVQRIFLESGNRR